MRSTLGRYIITAISVAVVVRMALLIYIVAAFGEPALLTGDSRQYMALGESLLSGNGYVYDGYVQSFRTPGYPAYFMVLQVLHIPLALGSLIQLLAASCLAGWAVWFSAKKLMLSHKAAFAVGLFAAIEPVQVYYGVMLLPDVFFAVCAIAAFTFSLKWLEENQLRYAAFAGIAIGIGNYIRPAMSFLPYMLAGAFIAYALWKSQSIRRAAAASALVLFFALLIMAPWSLRNLRQFDHYAFSATASYTLFAYGAANTL